MEATAKKVRAPRKTSTKKQLAAVPEVLLSPEDVAAAQDMGLPVEPITVCPDMDRICLECPDKDRCTVDLTVDVPKAHGPVTQIAPPPIAKIEPKYHRILVCGSRSHWEYDLVAGFVSEVVAKFPDAKVFISGKAKGADAISAYILEKKLNKKVRRIEVTKEEWADLGGAAGFARNWKMLMQCDAVAALWDGSSRGTKATIDGAKRLGKPVFEWTIPAIPEPEDHKAKYGNGKKK
jgi:hypothetical protein